MTGAQLVRPSDERPHLPGDDPEWREWWWFSTLTAPVGRPSWVPPDLVEPPASGSPAGQMNLSVGLCLLPNQGTACYWAGLDWPARSGDEPGLPAMPGSPVVVWDDSVPLPQDGQLEIRADGLWAEHAIEASLEQMGLGCEAFGLKLSSWEDLRAEPLVGERVPFGFDVEWATVDGENPQALDLTSTPASQGYRLTCTVFGEILVGDHRLDIDASGYRAHGWTT